MIMKVKNIFVLIVTAVLLAGCTQNHGYIGRLFGSWTLYAMTENGENVDISVHGDTFWSFQSDVIMMTRVFDHGTHEKRFGTWTETDNELILNFNHKYEGTPSGTGAYAPFEWLGMPGTDNIVLHYIEKERQRMAFDYTAPDGTEYQYFLKKTY